MMRWLVLACLVLAACHRGAPDYIGYDWNDRRVLCAANVDDLNAKIDRAYIHDQIEAARDGGWALLLYAHVPGQSMSLEWLEQILTWADEAGLHYYTYRELVPDEARGKHPGLAIAFDDASVEAWMTALPVLQAHHAHVTFFVAWFSKLSPELRAQLVRLHDAGNDVEPHSVDHLNAVDYVAANGLDKYISEQVLPSFKVLTDAGFPEPYAFAYPFGAHTTEIDDAVLAHVHFVRAIRGSCPWRHHSDE